MSFFLTDRFNVGVKIIVGPLICQAGIHTRDAAPIALRARLLKPHAGGLELHNTVWKWSDEWIESDAMDAGKIESLRIRNLHTTNR
jgi:hypothetical protein